MKYTLSKKWDSNRPIHLKMGFIIAIGLVLMAFNYTKEKPDNTQYNLDDLVEDSEILITPPVTAHIAKSIPPPPKPKIEKVVIENQIEFVDEKPIFEEKPNVEFVENSDAKENIQGETTVADPPPVVIIVEEPEDNTPISIAERMPVYGDCYESQDENQRRECTQKYLLEHIYKNIKYPAIAREANIEGTVVVSFVVDKYGKVKDISLLRDIGVGCGNEVLKAIKKLAIFKPGKQNGKPVNVVYRVPVHFRLM
ncbi:MAG: TonB family protein [Saprospiraceae bacterium]